MEMNFYYFLTQNSSGQLTRVTLFKKGSSDVNGMLVYLAESLYKR